jgi:hypothetical protein
MSPRVPRLHSRASQGSDRSRAQPECKTFGVLCPVGLVRSRRGAGILVAAVLALALAGCAGSGNKPVPDWLKKEARKLAVRLGVPTATATYVLGRRPIVLLAGDFGCRGFRVGSCRFAWARYDALTHRRGGSGACGLPTGAACVRAILDRTVRIYFFSRSDVPVFVLRRVSTEPTLVQNAIRSLSVGPTALERARGLRTALPSGSSLQKVSVTSQTATLWLTGLDPPYKPSMLEFARRLDQLAYTTLGIHNITRVRFRVSGRPWDFSTMPTGRIENGETLPSLRWATVCHGRVLVDCRPSPFG